MKYTEIPADTILIPGSANWQSSQIREQVQDECTGLTFIERFQACFMQGQTASDHTFSLYDSV